MQLFTRPVGQMLGANSDFQEIKMDDIFVEHKILQDVLTELLLLSISKCNKMCV